MRILYALDQYRPKIDGVVISIERQAMGLTDRGHDVAIVATGTRFADYTEHENGLTVFRVRSVRVLLDTWRLAVMPRPSVERVMNTFQPDIVVVNVPLPLNQSAASLARKMDVPLVGITGTMPEWVIYTLGFLKPVSKMISSSVWTYLTAYYNRCDAVVGVTPTAINYLRDRGLSRPSHVISNGVQLEKFRPQLRDDILAERLGIPDKPTVLYTGRLDAEKCMDVWIKAIPHVLRHIDAHFVIGGDGLQRRSLEEMVDKLGVRDHVTFTGFLSDDDYWRLYSLGHVFAITSPAELQSIVTLEAASSGLPIVAVNAGALPELVHEGRNGYLINLGDSEHLADRVVRLLSDDVTRRRMGRESRVIAGRHDLTHTVRSYERVYQDIVNARAKGLHFRDLKVSNDR